MRILVVGAGATGGYFGGRLLEAGRDVTFLVRPARAERLAATGLVIRSVHGDAALPSPPTVLAEDLGGRGPFDAVLLSCKAYDLDAAIEAFAPAVGARTVVLPMLNGMRHLDALDARFGVERVLGGACFISAALDDEGRILHRNDVHGLVYGARADGQRASVGAISAAMEGVRFNARASDDVLLDMWEKWAFLAALAGATCLMRASIGDIAAAGGPDLPLALLDECVAIAASAGRPPREKYLAWARGILTAQGSPMTASMLGDVERGAPTEADHILGDLLRRAPGGPGAGASSPLRTAYLALKAYEARRLRERPGSH
ncbi:2-dehydropantoate 2-reductase [Aquisphaera giovannonii]|uniref:2-dehydropantoate 2-reductase n=1 Tax=Aquisphaera giovannonii TaxID=406548 RepID=A0A5B9VTW9_9BACT|nr:2-dehydropantoate 2-reductase [Aquisphaera giovannonii]QEH31986.1 2-dehydropantoate 2-reductase [Aquisphaera giovannonii]